jgi:NRAMP (natural resistance-associated macrophage protein)-like metal ion transporter
LCEIAISACDLAELVGSAIALQLLFSIPFAVGVCITALDVFGILFLQNKFINPTWLKVLDCAVATIVVRLNG